jgi:MFS family permease
LGISSQQVGIIGTVYIAGAVFGSLVFGLLAGTWAPSFKALLDARLKSVSVALCADKYGRKKFFVVTPAIILCSSFATAFSWDYYSFLVCNFFTGIGIGAPLPGQPRAEAAI